MKERPITFSGPMVCAIIDGRKTQTRRVIKPQPPATATFDMFVCDPSLSARFNVEDPFGMWTKQCPHGQPGDRLWVRETWAPVDEMTDGFVREDPTCVGYRADLVAIRHEGGQRIPLDVSNWNWEHSSIRWRPSIHMPRWASRLTLEVTGVRVERVQDVSADDMLAEGVGDPIGTPLLYGHVTEMWLHRCFSIEWNAINGKRKGCTWADNPWVFVVEFVRC